MTKKHYIAGSLILVTACLISFNLGIYYNKNFSSKKITNSQTELGENRFERQNGNFQGRMQNGDRSQFGPGSNGTDRGGMMANRGAVGEIISSDGSTMSIKLRDGGSKIVLLTQTTKISKAIDGILSDLVPEKSVIITGINNPDGSITAESISIR